MLTLLLSLSALAANHEVEVAPSEVTVFADRAQVTRTARVNLSAGEHRVTFTGLPPGVMPDTVTADAPGATLAGVDTEHVAAAQVADARVAELDAQLRDLRDRRRDLTDDQAAASRELQNLVQSRAQSLQALNQQLLVGTAGPARARALRTTLARQEAGVRAEIRATGISLRDLNKEIAALERERGGLGSSATDTWSATVLVETARSGTVAVSVTYMVPGAGWAPRYDIRGDADSGDVSLSLSAMVHQTTGEDWTGVELAVSSATPGVGTVIPTLDPYWLARPVYTNFALSGGGGVRLSAAPAAMAKEAELDDAPAPAPPPAPMEIATAEVQVALSATTFSVARPEDIPTDGTQRKVLLTTEDLTADLRHVVVPRLDPRAWLVGEVENTADFPLLAGEAGVFLDGAFLGDFFLATVAPGDEFDLSFGVDDRVRVERTPHDIVRDQERPTGRKLVSRWEWRDRVHNTHRRPIHVELWEQVPLSPLDAVDVERLPLTSGTPEPEEERGGLLVFRYDLSAGQDSTLGWGYRVTYPSDITLGWME